MIKAFCKGFEWTIKAVLAVLGFYVAMLMIAMAFNVLFG